MKTNLKFILLVIVFPMLVDTCTSCSKSMISPNGGVSTDVYTITRIKPYKNFYLIEASPVGSKHKIKIISFRTSYIGEECVKVRGSYQLDLVYLYDYIYFREEEWNNGIDFCDFASYCCFLMPPDVDKVYIAGNTLKLNLKEDCLVLYCARNLSGLYLINDNQPAKDEVKRMWEIWHRPKNIPYLNVFTIDLIRKKRFLEYMKEIEEMKNHLKEMKRNEKR